MDDVFVYTTLIPNLILGFTILLIVFGIIALVKIMKK